MFKPLSFIKKAFGIAPKIVESVPMADAVRMPDIKIPKAKKIKRWGTPVVHTARNCLACGAPNALGPGQIRYTCSDICRKMRRGGKENKKQLEAQLKMGGLGWTRRQIAVYQYRKTMGVISSGIGRRSSITPKESNTELVAAEIKK